MIELAVGLRRFGGLVADMYVHGDLHTSTPTRIEDALAAEDEVPPEAWFGMLPSTLLAADRPGGLLSKCCEFYTRGLGRKGKILRCQCRETHKQINLLLFDFR